MAPTSATDKDWQRWGERNPYYGVLADPQYLDANLNGDSMQRFFASGEQHVEHVLQVIRASHPDFQTERVLDYGCGTGRLVIPFAARFQTVVGVDVSPGMLAEARENCTKVGASSVQLLDLDAMDALESASFDLVHSYIVFQHIPVARGELIIRKLIGLIAEGGMGALHFNYSDTRSAVQRGVSAMRRSIKPVHSMLNLIQRRPFSTPLMQMNCYSMNRIFDILWDAGCANLQVEFSDHGGFHTAMLYFEKSPGSA